MPKKTPKARHETHPPKLKDLLDAERALLGARLAAARAALGSHAGEMGTSLEHEARAFLRTFLPREYGLGRGFVVWRESCDLADEGEGTFLFSPGHRYKVAVSTQLDIIVYDAVRGGAIGDLGTAQIYPIEHVYGYVEVKAVFLDDLRQSLLVSKRLRSTNSGLFIARPQALQRLLAPGPAEIVSAQLQEAGRNTGLGFEMERPRLSCWFIAFEYARGRKSRRRAADISRNFEARWRRVKHWARFEGVLLLNLRTRQGEGAAFLRSIPDAEGKRPFASELALDGAVGRFKAQMLTDLAMTDRLPTDVAVLYEGYWTT